MPPRVLVLPSEVGNHKLRTPASIGDLREALYITNGIVVYAIVPQKYQRAKHVLIDSVTNNPKIIDQEIARRLAKLGPVSTLFSLDVWQNAVFIPYVRDMVSLADILAIRESWSFKQEHVNILVDDILTGLSSLREVGLQKVTLSLEDILLVRRQDLSYFQIAGLENCICFEGNEPTDQRDLQSFQTLLQKVENLYRTHKSSLIPNLRNALFKSRILGNEGSLERYRMEHNRLMDEHEKQRNKENTLPYQKNRLRMELDTYVDAVRVLGTTSGWTLPQNETIR